MLSLEGQSTSGEFEKRHALENMTIYTAFMTYPALLSFSDRIFHLCDGS